MIAAAIACVVLGAAFFAYSVTTGSLEALYVSVAASVVALLILAAAIVRFRHQTVEPPPDER